MIIFLYGEDTYRSRRKLKEIIDEYKKIHKSGLNFIRLDMEEKKFDDFKSNFSSFSMFKEKKFAVIENLFLKNNRGLEEEFSEYFKNYSLVDDTGSIIVFWDSEIKDSKNIFFKFLLRNAKCQKFDMLTGLKLLNWIKKEFRNEGGNSFKISSSAVQKLVDFIGNDLWRMSQEIRKLINYKKNIEVEDVEVLVSGELNTDIFKTIDALGARDKKEALKLIYEHLKKEGNESYLLSMIAYQFRNLIKIKILMEIKTPYYSLAKSSGLHPFVVKKASWQSQKFSLEELKKIYHSLFRADLAIKTGRFDSQTALDLLIASI